MMTYLAASICSSFVLKVGRSLVFVAVALAAMDNVTALDVTVGSRELIYTTKQRKSKGLSTWPDGNLGVVANGLGGYEFYAANGSKPVKTTGTLTDPGRSKQKVKIENLPKKTFDYVAGGPVYRDPTTGARLMVYHAEKHGRSAKDFYSVLGLAVSTDAAGLTFRDLGTIIEPNLQTGRAEVGGGSFAVVDDQLHVYYRDSFTTGGTSEVAVARAPISDLIGNALIGAGTLFNKYYNGDWTQPGRGGLSSPLEIGNPPNSWLSVSNNDYLNELVMVTSQWGSGGGDLYLATSPDGINWSPRQPIALDAGEQFYPSLIGTGPDPTHTGQSFYVYYTDSQKGAWSRWKDAQLVRREITINSLPIAESPALVLPGPPPSTITDWTAVADYQGDFQSGSPAQGWTYAWNATGRLGDSAAFLPLVWSDVAQLYNTTGAATQAPGSTIHNDDYLSLSAGGGHPGHPNYMPIVGYTIQTDDGAGWYRIADSSIAKLDGILSPNEDDLEVLVYLNNSLLGPAQGVSTNGLVTSFDRELGELQPGDTVWVMVDPLNNLYHDSFINFDFTIQRGDTGMAVSSFLSAAAVPEPNTGLLVLLGFAGCCLTRSRRYWIGF
jgi:hypothetical protein